MKSMAMKREQSNKMWQERYFLDYLSKIFEVSQQEGNMVIHRALAQEGEWGLLLCTTVNSTLESIRREREKLNFKQNVKAFWGG